MYDSSCDASIVSDILSAEACTIDSIDGAPHVASVSSGGAEASV